MVREDALHLMPALVACEHVLYVLLDGRDDGQGDVYHLTALAHLYLCRVEGLAADGAYVGNGAGLTAVRMLRPFYCMPLVTNPSSRSLARRLALAPCARNGERVLRWRKAAVAACGLGSRLAVVLLIAGQLLLQFSDALLAGVYDCIFLRNNGILLF